MPPETPRAGEAAEVAIWSPGDLPGPESEALRYGRGVFTSLRLEAGRVFRAREHHARLCASALALELEAPTWETFQRGLRALSEAGEDGQLRFFIGSMLPGLPEAAVWSTLSQLPPKPSAAWVLRLFSHSHFPTHPLSTHKSLACLDRIIWGRRARQDGADEAILCTSTGQVAEGSRSTLFACFGDKVLTPPLDLGLVPGITRAVLLEHPRVSEACLDREALLKASEVFVANAVRGVLPATLGHVRPGPITEELRRWYLRRWAAEAEDVAAER